MALPEKFVEHTLCEWGEVEGRALCIALDSDSPIAVRINPDKTTTDITSLSQLSIDQRVSWCNTGYYLTERPAFTFDSDFHAGAYYVQEPSSQFVEYLLQHVEMRGARILDMCAAPGGKTTLYASLVGAKGLVVANEIDRRRAQVLADNVRKWGTGNVVVTLGDSSSWGESTGWFDVVAVDAPCSGEGMFRKDPQARTEWSEGNVKLCATRQDTILRDAWQALRAGGTLIYSTCTFNRTEDEGSLERMLEWAGDAVVEAQNIVTDPAWGIVCGRVGAFQTFRFFPHRTCGEGFFAAVARKSFDTGEPERIPKSRNTTISAVNKSIETELRRWITEPDQFTFGMVGDTCYGWPTEQFEKVRLLSEKKTVIYSGVAMGQLFKGVLKPDPALAFAVGLHREALPVTELSSEQTLRFLRRQDIDASQLAEGMNLIIARGRALGFAKRIGNRVNNLYPNSLRILKND